MARTDGKSENQHYVPKMLLRNFGLGKKSHEKLYVFDKHENRVWPHATAIQNLSVERGFYDVQLGEELVASIEQPLSFIEEQTEKAFRKILVDQSLKNLSLEDRGWIYTFVAAQFLRGKHFRENISNLNKAIYEKIMQIGGDQKKVENISLIKNENDLKLESINFLRKSLPDFLKYIAIKDMLLFVNSTATPFWISDNPISMHNDKEYGPYGNLGLMVKGIQIHLPLSPRLSLAFWCPSIIAETNKAAAEISNSINKIKGSLILMPGLDRSNANELLNQCEKSLSGHKRISKGLESGDAIECTNENIEFYNSLQAIWAYRFVMSPEQEFSLAKRVVEEMPRFRKGVGFTI